MATADRTITVDNFYIFCNCKIQKNKVLQWFHLTVLQLSKCKCMYTAHRTKFQPEWKWCMLWHSTQSSPRHSWLSKCHTLLQYTHTHTHTRYFIYAHKESKAFHKSSFTYLINAQQCYTHISYPVSPKSENKCVKYGYKLTYISK